MTNIKNIFKKGLSLAVVALAILFSFAFNPAVAHADGYCCGGDITFLGAEGGDSCKVEYAPGYEYTSAVLINTDFETDVVFDAAAGQPILLEAGGAVVVDLPPYDEFYLDKGNGRVYFLCEK